MDRTPLSTQLTPTRAKKDVNPVIDVLQMNSSSHLSVTINKNRWARKGCRSLSLVRFQTMHTGSRAYLWLVEFNETATLSPGSVYLFLAGIVRPREQAACE